LDNIRITVPIESEQKSIANFLDKKISQINQTIEKDKRLIELLKEKRIFRPKV
jgi:predicted metal-dependent hydrolase